MSNNVPGGMFDMVSQHQEQVTPDVPIPVNDPEPVGGLVVPVRQDNPEEAIPRTLQLSGTNPFGMLLPRDMQRRRAVIMPQGNDVWLCESREMASQANASAVATFSLGAYIPKGTVIALESRDQLWAAVSTTSSTTSIAVIVERYADPLP